MGIREDVLSKQDRIIKAVDVPEWGCTIHVRTLTGEEHDSLHQLVFGIGDKKVPFIDVEIASIIAGACDENGAPIFQGTDVPVLKKKSTRALRRVYDAFDALNVGSAAKQEEVEKNSETTTALSSGSD